MMKIGVIPDSFQVPFKEAVILARDMGVKGLQPYVTGGELCPEKLSKEEKYAVTVEFFKNILFAFQRYDRDWKTLKELWNVIFVGYPFTGQ